jgi:hypothetical protein
MADPILSNEATAMSYRLMDIVHSGQLDQLDPAVAADVCRIDHRRGVSAPNIEGLEDWLEYVKASVSVGFVAYQGTPLATLGDRHALIDSKWGTGEGVEVVFLMVLELNEQHQVSYLGQYDLEDEAAARADLQSRYEAAISE